MPKTSKKAAPRKSARKSSRVSARKSASKPVREPLRPDAVKKAKKPAQGSSVRAQPPVPPRVSSEQTSALVQSAQVLTAAAAGVVAVSPDGIITFANPAAADLLNRDSSAMVGLSVER